MQVSFYTKVTILKNFAQFEHKIPIYDSIFPGGVRGSTTSSCIVYDYTTSRHTDMQYITSRLTDMQYITSGHTDTQ